MLTKTTTKMTLVNQNPIKPIFSTKFDDESRSHFFDMDPDVWMDLGKPETITVTIEPGDKLNGN